LAPSLGMVDSMKARWWFKWTGLGQIGRGLRSGRRKGKIRKGGGGFVNRFTIGHGEDAYETAGVRGRSPRKKTLSGDLIRLKRIVIGWGWPKP
jgi:hypothetical protein